ncbi:GNAT family N-acetyltransferase [Pediococcus claussenii]|uniref:Acetyltransferase n=1 Tax=Pediococcus claussenii (strain ATCC BAA-344 / DSM 14800 / JCM 18046 / KCTC 3811 / LMG 21948 / P06) TaxID=701521 RepID=G8PEV3_PEDCP|nr:GNAT family N-acetyltransferase [Pediococcus claussenii]AEV94483.1 acetyltransferase [Pediococcus claussenii ATCC BAA-344]ANZ69700.1 hypothetical protein AYR57_04945 [Pediococcus claussenii]ANZ71517.1 hypothetical protein AYR58_04950 [Pediococcus claussenii]KRN19811.1 hypothetical protein IV79_GL001099 [Pediococcus claussenii]
MTQFKLGPNEREQMYQLYLYAFNALDSEQRQSFWSDRFEHAIPYGIQDHSKIQSGLLSIPFTVNFFGVVMKMNGICDVMSAPEASGKGGAGLLLQDALHDMYNDGITLSYLAPFSFRYYRRFGYEQTFDHITYTIPSNQLPKVIGNDNFEIKRGPLSEFIEAIAPLYQKSAENHRGGLVREQWWWEYLTKKAPQRQIAVAQHNGRLVGYLIYERTVDKFIVHEVYASVPEARQSLWNFVAKHRSSVKTFEYQSANPENHLDMVEDPWDVTASIHPYMMARIVNLKDFVSKYPISKLKIVKPVTFSVEDDVIKENEGTWRLSAVEGVVSFEKVSTQKDNDTLLTIQELTKTLFGYRKLSSLAKHAKISHSFDSATLEQIDRFAIGQKPVLADYF